MIDAAELEPILVLPAGLDPFEAADQEPPSHPCTRDGRSARGSTARAGWGLSSPPPPPPMSACPKRASPPMSPKD
ncbi:hypothetical protein ACFQ4K_02980 [Tistrella bauzanensis]